MKLMQATAQAANRLTDLMRREDPKLIQELEDQRKQSEIDAFFAQLGRNAQYTPDILLLESRARWNIFVFDDMLSGHRLHDYITETNLWGRRPNSGGYSVLNFHMWYKDLGKESYPVALRSPVTGWHRTPTEPAPIWGQIYSIRGYQIKKLDFLRMNTVQFERIRVPILVPIDYKVIYDKRRPNPALTPSSIDIIECWMYVGKWDFWNDQLAGFLPSHPVPLIPHKNPRIGDHYNYEKHFKELNAKRVREEDPPF